MPKKTLAQAAHDLAHRLDDLALISDDASALTRTFLSPAMRKANALVGEWMRGAGLVTREDRVGNLIGRTASPEGVPLLLLGSHLDTVRDAGRFDGALGVLISIAALEVLRSRATVLPFAVEVLGFAEEEGVRFSSAYLGSKGYLGRLPRSDLKRRDSEGVTLGEVLEKYNRGLTTLPQPAHSARDLLGYLEVHIEQGPVLEARGLAVGVVSAISGQTRAKVLFEGQAGHAGTTPMALRRDALTGAAEFILAVEALARSKPPLVATVGHVLARPGAANVIAGRAELTLDVRHPADKQRLAAMARLQKTGRALARRRGLRFSMEVTQDNGAVSCSKELTGLLADSVRARQGRALALPSGAGHDAVVISALGPVAMLFVRCRRGLSHHPDEFVHPRDLRVALDVVVEFLTRLASRNES